VFIDSMMMVCASEESLDEQKQFMTDTVRFAQETGLHVHLVAHCRKPQQGEDRPPTKYDLRGSAAISDQAHNVVTVWANKAKKQKPDDDLAGDPDALVTVEKQRNGSYEGKVKLWFDDSSLRFCDDRTSAVEPYVIREV
jgi:twinkle protein